VRDQGWTGKRNGELLRLSESDFDAFVTMDRGLQYQQNLAGFKLAILVVRAQSNRLLDVLPVLPRGCVEFGAAWPGRGCLVSRSWHLFQRFSWRSDARQFGQEQRKNGGWEK
jgi:hypothetical protein